MKSLLLFAALTVVAVTAHAQGQFNFGNRVILSAIDAKAFWIDGVTPLAGDAFWAQAYVGQAIDSLAPVDVPVPFRTGAAAGYITTKTVTTPFAGGTQVLVEMRVWEASGGNTYEAAVAAGKYFGRSMPVQLTVAVAPSTPPDMVGLMSWVLIPEPSPLVLSLLGAGALLWRRPRARLRATAAWLILGAVLATPLARAQGQFNFGNRRILSDIDAPVWRCPPGWCELLSGDRWWVQAYVGLQQDSLQPVDVPVRFRRGAAAGYIYTQVVTTPYPGGTPIWVEMRVWDAYRGDSYEAVAAADGECGRSLPVQLTVAELPNELPYMVGLKTFGLINVPEPPAAALGLLGITGLCASRGRRAAPPLRPRR